MQELVCMNGDINQRVAAKLVAEHLTPGGIFFFLWLVWSMHRTLPSRVTATLT